MEVFLIEMQCYCSAAESLQWKKYTAKPCEISKDHVKVTQIPDSLVGHDGTFDKNTGKMMKYIISLFTDFPFISFFQSVGETKSLK